MRRRFVQRLIFALQVPRVGLFRPVEKFNFRLHCIHFVVLFVTLNAPAHVGNCVNYDTKLSFKF